MGRVFKGMAARKIGATSQVEMKKAVDLHIKNGVSIRKASRDCKIPYPTLRRYVKKYLQDSSAVLEPNYAVNKVFTSEQEDALHEYIVDCSNKFYGLSTKDCRRLAYEMAEINKISMPSTWVTNKMAGKDWLQNFRRRHPDLSLKKPEACSVARATAFNRINVKKFYDNLKDVLQRDASFADGSRVYNLDETSTTTVQRPGKILTPKGRTACKVTSGERGVLVTTCCIVNAIGQALPPVMVFPRKNFKDHMLYGAPPGTLGVAAPSGWMNGELFVQVMAHFIKHTAASKDHPALLIMDNHESHLSLQALDLAKASGVTILTLHPHTTAKMQPLDVGLLAPFKAYYNGAVDSWLLRNPGRPMTIYNIAECVGPAYMKSMTPTNIVNAFKKCGIFPYDDQLFTDADFLPSTVTDRPQPTIEIEEGSDVTDAEDVAEHDENSMDCNKTCASPSLLYGNTAPLIENDTIAAVNLMEDYTQSSTSAEPTTFSTAVELVEDHEQPSTSRAASNFISPKVFCKPLKAKPRKTIRKAGRSLIATDTPEKDALAALKNTKNKGKKIKNTPAKKVKQDLFNEAKKVRRNERSAVASDSSDDEQAVFEPSGSSSGGEQFWSDAEKEEVVLDDDFPPLTKEPVPNDYVIILFKSKNINVYYVAQILEKLDDDDCDYYVSYLKLKSKANQKFVEPIIPDTAGVATSEIKYVLPAPKVDGTTSRRQATLKFDVDMSLLNLRF